MHANSLPFMSSFDPFGKDSLAFMLIAGILVFLTFVLAYIAAVFLSILIFVAGLLNFIKDTKNILALIVMIVGVVAAAVTLMFPMFF